MSKYTAIVRKKPSLPLRYLLEHNKIYGRVLDYGCGRAFDVRYLVRLGFDITGYDPFWKPYDNVQFHNFGYHVILCNYVLNVVDEDTQELILMDIEDLLAPEGVAYITVRRDIKEDRPGIGCIQRVVELPYPIEYEKKGAFVIYRYD